jgi:hypothetical protein
MSQIIDFFDAAFRQIHERSSELLGLLSPTELYLRPQHSLATLNPLSTGEFLLRSAAAVEQFSGGITRRLWDDPFEWTLPEKLATKEMVLEYLDEVEAARTKAFDFIKTDDELLKTIPAPTDLRPIGEIIIEALTRSAHYQGRAFAAYQILIGNKPPRV